MDEAKARANLQALVCVPQGGWVAVRVNGLVMGEMQKRRRGYWLLRGLASRNTLEVFQSVWKDWKKMVNFLKPRTGIPNDAQETPQNAYNLILLTKPFLIPVNSPL